MRAFFFFVSAITIAIISLCNTSCISDSVSTSPTDILTFSRDTVNFDTVFTGFGTPTARLVVANRAKKGIVISSIRLKNPDTPFQINVDGVTGKAFNDVEIWKEDSIYLFIECLLPETGTDLPYRVEDELEFVTNGVTQSVLLEAYGQNVVRLKAARLTDYNRFTADRPYIVFDSLVVDKNAILRIDPGVKLLFHDGAELIVHGNLQAVGETGKMIQFRGDRLDEVLPGIGYDLLSGQWKGIRIARESFENRLEFVDMRSTTDGLRVDSCGDLTMKKLYIYNSWLHNTQGRVLDAKYSWIEAEGVCFSEAAKAVVSLTGGRSRFVQCTIANNYLFAAISEPLLCLYHCIPKHQEDDPSNPNPLMMGWFDNSIIYGIGGDLNIGDFTDSSVYFTRTSFKSGGEDDDHFIECLWECDPMFLTERPNYYFNYHVAWDSPVVGMGSPKFLTPALLRDMDGDLRNPAAPTLGAYVAAPKPE